MLGYSPRIYKTSGVTTEWKNGTYSSKDRYDLKILKRNEVLRFGNEIGFIQKYKQNLILSLKECDSKIKNVSNNILEKIFIGKMEVFHIEVDNPTHTYWTNGLNVSNCVLSSMNVAKYDEWKNTDAVFWATIFLDCVAQEFIDHAEGKAGLEKALKFTKKGRALGLGQCGFHTYLQQKMIPFESLEAQFLNTEIAKNIQDQAEIATSDMAKRLGEPEWCEGYDRRNTHLIAIAPTKSTALIMGGISEGINPDPVMIYSQLSAGGEVFRINPILLDLMKKYGKYNKKNIKNIIDDSGSVRNVSWLSKTEKDVLKGGAEIDQHVIIRLAAQRQQFVDQAQSINLFFTPKTSEKYISEVHKSALKNKDIISLYYANTISGDYSPEDSECVSCQ